MFINNFNKLIVATKKNPPIKLAIAQPHNEHVLESLSLATKKNIITPYLIGNKNLIQKLANEHNIDISNFHITNLDNQKSILHAIDLVKQKECNLLMKGDHSTASIMSLVLKRDNNLKLNKVLSHIYILQLPSYHKLLLITDGALNIAPSLNEQKEILKNAILLTKVLGINTPKVALLSAVETLSAKIPSTITADALAKDLSLKQNTIIEGPLAFDGAISKEAALTKHISSEVAGDIDIALVPNIEAGNMLAKSLIYLGGAIAAGIILGAKVPIILTSRSDSTTTKFLSIALGSLYINGVKNV